MYLFFVHSYVASKIETKEKNRRESNNELKSLIDLNLNLNLNLNLDDAGTCEETTAFVKKGVLNLTYIQGLLFENSPNSPTSLQQVKLLKLLEKYPKLEVVMIRKYAIIILTFG